MKINIRFLFIFLLFIVVSKCGKLTEDENLIRLSNCGMEMLPHVNDSTNPFRLQNYEWIALLANSGPRLDIFGLGSFISPRHVLTSFASSGNLNFVKVAVYSEWGFFKIPVDKLIIRMLRGNIFHDFDIEKVWVMLFKSLITSQDRGMFAILELKQDVSDIKYPCLVERSTNLSEIENVHVYNNNQQLGEHVDFRFIKVQNYSDDHRWITVKRYNAIGVGDPMIVHENGKVTIIGIGGNNLFQSCSSACNDTHFLSLQFITEGICHLTGVCELLPITTPTSTIPTSFSSSSFSTLTPEEEIRYWDEYEDNYETDISNERRNGNCAWNFLGMAVLVFSFWWEIWFLV